MAKNSKTGRLDFYRTRLAEETPLTMGVLLALSQADLSYKPHERSSAAAQIISTIIRHLEICNDLAAKRQADVAPRSADSYKELIREFEEQSVALGKRLSQLKQQQWEETSQLRLGEQVILERPLGEIMWLFHFDSIHHRGQLSTYLRPMGAKVPSIYGKSGDENRG
ncbi:MAG: DinB family protein [Candidatus Acidiferrales bacterium]|jgi:hypothetical protein